MAGQIFHEWNGTVLTVTSDSGTSSCDLKGSTGDMGIRGPQGPVSTTPGPDGKDGYTPVRGTDYWTIEDIAEIKAYVDDVILGGKW